MHLHIARLRTRRGPCSTQRCRPQPIAAGHLVAHPAACKAAAVLAPFTWLARRLPRHADRGNHAAPQCVRGRCRQPLPSPFPCPRDPRALGFWRLPLTPCEPAMPHVFPPASVTGASGLVGSSCVLSLVVPGCRRLSACLGLTAAGRRANSSRLRWPWGGGGGVRGSGGRCHCIRSRGVCYTEKATPARHRPERQHNARSNRRKQCSSNETIPYPSPTPPRKRQNTPTNGHTPHRMNDR